mgnify:CR=1 FL=1
MKLITRKGIYIKPYINHTFLITESCYPLKENVESYFLMKGTICYKQIFKVETL